VMFISGVSSSYLVIHVYPHSEQVYFRVNTPKFHI